MKRCWFGGALLILLLIGGLLVTAGMSKNHELAAQMLEEAAFSAMTENWKDAGDHLEEAHEVWEEKWHFSAAFADHEPMEEIDGMFAQARVYLLRRNPEALAAVCAQLAEMTRAIGESHRLKWWNFL